jgi:hypothetical protein
MITREDFEQLAAEILANQNTFEKDEYYQTPHDACKEVFDQIRVHLFSEDMDREERRQQWLKLNEEFNPEYIPPTAT